MVVTSSLTLNGFYLSDNENDLTKWSFPNTTIQPNDYLNCLVRYCWEFSNWFTYYLPTICRSRRSVFV